MQRRPDIVVDIAKQQCIAIEIKVIGEDRQHQDMRI